MTEKRRLKVDMDALAGVFELHFDEINSYLDLETGEVLQVNNETYRLLERLYEESYTGAEEQATPLETLLAQHPEIQDWEKETLLEADRVERGFGKRIVAIDPEPYSDYNDMESFVYTVADARLANELEYAIRGRGAFRRFKDILARHPQLQNAWYAFQDAQIKKRVRELLEVFGIEPVIE
jgi:hypothetical protein